MKIINIILLLFLLILAYMAYNIYQDLPIDQKELSIIFQEKLPDVENTSSELVQFAPNMRFSTNRLSYYFQPECSSEKRESVKNAFKILSEETAILFFSESPLLKEETHIIIRCSEEAAKKQSYDESTFIAGEGGPTKFLTLEPYSLIMQGEIQLYHLRSAEKCDGPLVEIHELLHVFGYDHVDNKESILYPILSCNQKITSEIIRDIQRLYSESAKAEISISNVSATKAGKYLNFFIEIKNTGLIETEDVVLSVYADEKLVEDFEIKNLLPGMTRSLDMKNLQLSSNKIKNIRFSVSSETEDYFLKNNVVEMVVE